MPQVNPDVLVWARESAGLNLQEAAKKLNFKDTKAATGAEKLKRFEDGSVPSASLLRKMSKQYRKPLVTFYLQERPAQTDSGEDFRTLREAVPPQQDALVETLLGKIKARQGLLKEAMIDEDEAVALEFVGKASLEDDPNELADRVKQFLKLDLQAFRGKANINEAFKYLRALVEDTGVYVLLAGNLGSHHSNIDAEIFRGFVLSDEVAPFIVINDQDAKSAWSFTLLHELIHIWLGRTGLSDQTSDNYVEQFCDKVTSQILLPEEEFATFIPTGDTVERLIEEISEYAQIAKLSRKLIAYRLHSRGVISNRIYMVASRMFYQEWQESKKAAKSTSGSGPNYYIVRKHRLGKALFEITKRLSQSGALSPSKAGILLDVSSINAMKLLKL